MNNLLPAGKYYLGDPCYVIDNDKWDEYLNPFWEDRGGIFEFDGHLCAAFYTRWGDGCYDCSDGSILGVDSGSIGAIPMVLCVGDIDSGTTVEFDTPVECYDSNGKLHFGGYTVDTDPEDEEEDEDDDY